MKISTLYLSCATAGLSALTLLALHLHAADQGPTAHRIVAHALGHAEPAVNEGPVTISFAQNDDFYLCNDPFWLGAYEMMAEVYTIGVENVSVELLQEKTFAFIRSWPEFTPEQEAGWLEHVKDIPAQFVAIIREDPTVLDSCANFSVAAVGPP